ncbi:TetR/AcrR family transcriptional regulator [Acetobacter fallax]|uniref:TetR family transcriptional regulator n=1 Tax=Acetobacter fallax TaxID=1737473 RepID=A0ABX0K7F6_9PROT|nr:TetR/AcrR family transcriptional regulator [Acetobacter fallax]NHO32332.1 TetR family transcriptional regulator [Acetobacter fallax]NHO35891.1 TetR family transcriptional regulator [Acetobacter fallax]
MSSSPSPPSRPCAADRIRSSARDLFYNQGIRAVGVEEIVQNAGVTKPSLYRAFESKDGLTTAYLADYQQSFWDRIEEVRRVHPDDPRARILAYFDGLAERASRPAYRGCALTNAIVEYPDADHPVRQEAARLKQDVRDWLRQQAHAMEAGAPDLLADGLILLMEGAYASGQVFASPGPAAQVGILARCLLDACCSGARRNVDPG